MIASTLRSPRVGVSTKLLFLTLLGMITELFIIAAITWYVAGEQAVNTVEKQIDIQLSEFRLSFQRELADLNTLGQWLVAQPDFLSLVRSRNTEGLTRLLEPLTKASIVDALTVTDADGLVLSRVRTLQPATSGDSVLEQPGIAEALKGQMSSGMENDKFGRLQGRFMLPIYDASSHALLGVLILAFNLDKDFLQSALKSPGMESVIIYQDRLVASTLPDQGNTFAGGQLAPGEVMVAERGRHSTQYFTIPTGQGDYFFKFDTVESPTHDVVGMYGVGIPWSFADELRAGLIRSYAMALVAACLITLVLGLIMARAIVSPIRILQTSAQSIAHGDLGTAIKLRRNDEFGDLAVQMNLMREQVGQALESAHLEKARYQAVIRSMGVAVVITDRDNRIIAVNHAAEQLVRAGEATLLAKSWQTVFVLKDRSDQAGAPFWDAGPAAASGSRMVMRGRFPLREHPQTVLDITSTPIEIEGMLFGYAHVIQDMSAHEQLVQAKDDFLLNVAHELRAPLAALRGSIEMLAEDYRTMTKDELKLMIRALERSITKHHVLIEHLVDIGNLRAGQFRVQPLPSRYASIAKEAADRVQPLLQAREQMLEVNFEFPAHCAVLADQRRIVQVLVNLLSNASKYGPEGQPVLLYVYCQDDWLYTEITDRGSGISPEDQAHLFERFFRAKRMEQEGTGIGLGLALAKGIVDAHGGQIGVRSQVGHGSTFWFSLPLAHANARNWDTE